MEDDDGVIAALTEGRRGVVASRAGLIATETGNVVGGQVEIHGREADGGDTGEVHAVQKSAYVVSVEGGGYANCCQYVGVRARGLGLTLTLTLEDVREGNSAEIEALPGRITGTVAEKWPHIVQEHWLEA